MPPQQSGGTPGHNVSPTRPGSLVNGTGLVGGGAGGISRDMNLAMAQHHMLQNQSMSNQNISMNQNQPNPGQQIPQILVNTADRI